MKGSRAMVGQLLSPSNHEKWRDFKELQLLTCSNCTCSASLKLPVTWKHKSQVLTSPVLALHKPAG